MSKNPVLSAGLESEKMADSTDGKSGTYTEMEIPISTSVPDPVPNCLAEATQLQIRGHLNFLVWINFAVATAHSNAH